MKGFRFKRAAAFLTCAVFLTGNISSVPALAQSAPNSEKTAVSPQVFPQDLNQSKVPEAL